MFGIVQLGGESEVQIIRKKHGASQIFSEKLKEMVSIRTSRALPDKLNPGVGFYLPPFFGPKR